MNQDSNKDSIRTSAPMIEPRIKPLVDLMNNTGLIRTVACCEGHGFRSRAPYVYFNSTVEYAQAFERYLRALCWGPDSGLNYDWIITGRFNGECELTFLLHSPALDQLARCSVFPGLLGWSFSVWKKKDFDLSILALKLRPFLLQVGDSNKPCVTDTGNQND